MFGFHTVACLGDIPVVRSSTSTIQEVYVKAKTKSPLIRIPCNLFEIVADRSLQIASTLANPFAKSLHVSAHAIDDFAVDKIRQIEVKYPVIKTPTEEVMNTLNRKAELFLLAINSVKDKTNSAIQYSKETVSNVISTTVNKATVVANAVYTFCETHVPGNTIPVHCNDFARRTSLLWNRLTSSIRLTVTNVIESVALLLICYRMFVVSFLLKSKAKISNTINAIEQIPFLSIFLKRFAIYTDIFFEYIIERIRPNVKKDDDDETSKQIQQKIQQKQQASRQTLKPGSLQSPHQDVRGKKEYSTISRSQSAKPQVDVDEKFNQILNAHHIDQLKPPTIEDIPSDDSDNYHEELKITNDEVLSPKLSTDDVSSTDDDKSSTEDEQIINTIFD